MKVKRLSGLSIAMMLAGSVGIAQAATDAELAGIATGGTAAATAPAAPDAAALQAKLQSLQQQVQLVNRFADRFQSDAAAQFGRDFNAMEWKLRFGSQLMQKPASALASAMSARDLGTAQSELARAITPKHGSDNHNVINFLSAPCRIVDTRLGGGGMLGPAFRFWYASNTPAVIAAQGGNAAGCGTFTNANLWFLYVTVVPPGAPLSGGANFLTVQHDASGPTTSTMNYYPGVNIANFAITANFDFSSTVGGFNAFASSPTHVVIDLVAWASTLGPAALQQANQTANVVVASGSFGSVCTAACPAGYTLTGGGCDWGSAGGLSKNIEETGPSRAPGQNGWCCGASQNIGANRTLEAIAYCTRIPTL